MNTPNSDDLAAVIKRHIDQQREKEQQRRASDDPSAPIPPRVGTTTIILDPLELTDQLQKLMPVHELAESVRSVSAMVGTMSTHLVRMDARIGDLEKNRLGDRESDKLALQDIRLSVSNVTSTMTTNLQTWQNAVEEGKKRTTEQQIKAWVAASMLGCIPTAWALFQFYKAFTGKA